MARRALLFVIGWLVGPLECPLTQRLQVFIEMLDIFFVICADQALLGITDGEPNSVTTTVGRCYISTKMNIVKTRVAQMSRVGLALPKNTTHLFLLSLNLPSSWDAR